MLLFDVSDHVDLEDGVALGRVLEGQKKHMTSLFTQHRYFGGARNRHRRPPYQHDHVHPALHQQVQPILIVVVGADGGAAQQLFARVLGGQREVSVLLQVGAGNDGHQRPLLVHDRQLTCRADRRKSNKVSTRACGSIFVTGFQR